LNLAQRCTPGQENQQKKPDCQPIAKQFE